MNGELSTENKSCKHINILLSRHFDTMSQFIYYLTGRGYTHASIGLEEDENTFYSFNGMGFRIEKPDRWKKKDERIITTVYRFDVGEITYQKVKDYIDEVKKNQECYKYSAFGVIMCILHIPYHARYRYFCSQFVAEALKQSEILNVPTPAHMILPNSLYNMLKVGLIPQMTYC